MLDDSLQYRLFNLLYSKPDISQRTVANSLGISLGKTNYCLRALMEKGWIKVKEFSREGNKRAYSYILTPKGLEEKAKVTLRFLRRKMAEYEVLQREIEELRQEIEEVSS